MRVLICLVLSLLACGGLESNDTMCVAPSTQRACADGGVVLFTQATDDAGATEGGMTSCIGTCPSGMACTFSVDGTWVDGVCR